MNETYDFVVIGGGSAGYAAASTASRLGLRVAVVEGGAEVGGLCILRGCMPSKALLETAHRAEVIRDAARFGLHAEYRGADGVAIQERTRSLVREFADYRREQLESGRFTFLRARARFVGAHNLELELLEGGVRRISGRAILLATGSRRKEVDVPGLRESGAWGSDEVLGSAEIPGSVVVLGGGAVAVELASYYAGFGCRVSLVQRGPRLLGALDPEVGAALEEGLNRRGVKVFCGTTLRRVERAGAGCRVVFSRGSVEHTVEADQLVEALGREPALEGLGLENAGFPAGTSRLEVGPTQQTEVPHLFAAGDVCGTADVVHVAVQQGELAARNAVAWLSGAGDLEKMDRRLALYAVFSRPEVASVGLTEREAAARGLEVDTAMHPFADHGRAMVAGELDGFVKLIVDRRTREILGASVVGAHASELVQEMVLAIHFRARAGDVAGLPHYHPTFGEIWTYPAEALA